MDIVRVSVPTMDAAEAFKLIKQQVSVPLVADIHFDYRIALKVAEYGVDCLRINRAISAARSVSVRWWIAPVIIISLSVSGLTVVHWKRYPGKIRRTDAGSTGGICHASCGHS